MKYLITTIAAVVLVGCGESKQPSPAPEAKQAPTIAKEPEISILDAAKGGNTALVKQHISTGADVNVKNELGMTPLFLATGMGHKEIAELLISKGADLNAKDKNGGTPLHIASSRGQTEIAQLLIASNAEVNAMILSGSYKGITPLDFATKFKRTEIANLLRKHGGKTGKELKGGEPVVKAAKPEPPKVEELLNSIGTPLNEMEKIISDEKYLEKLVGDSSAPRETINRANHTYSILYIYEEDRTLVHGVWMIKDDTFYYMELVSNDIQIPEEEREVLSANIISLKKDKIQLSIPPIDENEEESRIILTAIGEFKEKEMKSFNNEQVNKNFNIFEKSR